MAGSLRQRSPGVWELRVFAGRDSVTGRQVSRSETFRGSKRDAERELARLVTDVRKPVGGRELPPNRVTLTQLIELHLAEHRGAPGTVGSYRSLLTRHISPAIGRLRVGAVDARTLDRFYDHLERQGLAASTIRSAHALVRGALRQAVRWGWLTTNVARDARPPTVRRDEVKLPTPAEVLAAIEAAEAYDPEFGVFVRLAAATGARRGELCALRWSDIDLDAGVIRIDASVVTAPGTGVFIKETKTHTRRGVAIDVSTMTALRRQLDLVTSRAAYCGVTVAGNAFVFSSEVNGCRPWRPEIASHRWDTVRRRAGIGAVRLHDLRHFQATMLLRGGVPVENVSKRLGHRDAATTLNVYAQFLEEADRQSAELIGRLLPGGPPSPAPAKEAKDWK